MFDYRWQIKRGTGITMTAEQAVTKTLNREQADYIDVLVDSLDCNRELLINGTNEYSLICLLQRSPFHLFDEHCLKQPSNMFSTHFILFHCLYKLRQRYFQDKIGELAIQTTAIKLNVYQSGNRNVNAKSDALATDDKLARYYSDLSNIDMSESEIEALLNSFWQRFANGAGKRYSEQEIHQALNVLGMSQADDISQRSVKLNYRKALSTHHPDKGGCVNDAQQIIRAYQVVCFHYSLK